VFSRVLHKITSEKQQDPGFQINSLEMFPQGNTETVHQTNETPHKKKLFLDLMMFGNAELEQSYNLYFNSHSESEQALSS